MEISEAQNSTRDNSLEVNQIIRADISKGIPLPDESVDVAITSPPYWGLRDYGIEGQLGLEPTFQEYIEKMLLITKELKRVLKKSGSFYLNMGDTYSGGGGGNYGDGLSVQSGATHPTLTSKPQSILSKSLCFIPERLAIRMEDEQKWIPRNKIIWFKPNHMPSSVTDRLTNSWEYLYHFAKSKKYYYNLDAIRVPHAESSYERANHSWKHSTRNKDATPPDTQQRWNVKELKYNFEKGKAPDDVYQGKFKGSEDAESFGSPQARTQRDKSIQEFFEKKGSEGNVNLTDRKYEKTDEIYGEDSGNRGRTREHLDNRKQDSVPSKNHNLYEGFNARLKESHGIYQEQGFAAKEKGWNDYKEKYQAEGRWMSDKYLQLGKNPSDIIEASPEVRAKSKLIKTHRMDIARIRAYGEGMIHWGDRHPSQDPSWYNKNGKNPSDFWEITTQPMKEAHFATFPERLCLQPLLSSCPPDGIVFDPFMGSGTVAVVAEKINRKMYEMNKIAKAIDYRIKWVGTEINPKYIEIAMCRLKPFMEQPRLDELS